MHTIRLLTSKLYIFQRNTIVFRFFVNFQKTIDLKSTLGVKIQIKIKIERVFKMKYQNLEEFEKANKFGMGEANIAYAKFFIGNSYLNPLTDSEKTSLFLANVTFEPGCRNNWHIHHAKKGGGQILICTAGEGWYQEEGEEAVSLKEGDVITIPPEVKHWHGAKKDSWFSHIAVEVPGEETSNEWCESVSDEEYNAL